MSKSLKTVLSIILAILMVATLVACGSGGTSTPTAPTADTPAAPEPPPVPEPPPPADSTPAADDTAPAAAGHAVFNSPSDFTVGFAIKNRHNAYLIAMSETMAARADEYGYNLIELNAGGDAAQQQADVEDLVAQGVDVIVMDSQDPTVSIAIADFVAENNIPLFFLNATPDPSCIRVTLVQSNNLLLGVGVGEWVADQMSGTDIRIGLLSGNPGNMTGYARRTGFITGLTERQLEQGNATNFIVRTQGWGNWAIEAGLEAAEDMLVGSPDINVIFAENDAMAFGAITAIENAGRTGEVLVVGVDGQRLALEAIERGEYGATGLNSPIELVNLAMGLMVDYMTGADRNIPVLINTTPGVAHAGNLADFWDSAF